MLVYVSLPEYLAQWFRNDMVGGRAVLLPRGSVEHMILETFLQPWPADVPRQEPKEGDVAIIIPRMKVKDPEVHCYLPPKAMTALIDAIHERFKLELWKELHRFGRIGRRQDNLIYAWMEAKGIEPTATNWDAIAKQYQRCRDVYNANRRRERYLDKQKNSKKQ